MADFCKDCSIELFGEDFKELANIAREGEAAYVLCEGCGYIWVNSKGERVETDYRVIWKKMENEKPPYCKNPTWFEVITRDGIVDTCCRWWDHWYQSLYTDYDTVFWRVKEDNKGFKEEKNKMDNKDKMYLRFEFVNEFGYKTILEKYLDSYYISELDTVVYEFANFLRACGFGDQNIKDMLDVDF